jgi:uncharacterized DUF497 family protein
MNYEWDPAKAESNRRKHWVRFSDAVLVFNDNQALTILDTRSKEERYIRIGMDGSARLLVVVYTWRGDVVRIISARKATRSEERQYTEGEP